MAVVTQATKFKVPREDNTVLIWSNTSVHDLLRSNELTRSTYPDWLKQLTVDARSELLDLLDSVSKRQACCCSCAQQSEELEGKDATGGGSTSVDSVRVDSIRQFQASDRLDHTAQGVLDANLDVHSHWILGGHQPELFHPGVWFKNFYLNKVASDLSSLGEPTLALHLVVDHDLARSTSLRVSRIVEGRLLLSSHAMPISKVNAAPWEATFYLESDRLAWERWIDDLIQDCATLGVAPILQTRREQFLELLRETNNIGEAFSMFRHVIEEDHGFDNHELPMSHVSSTRAFGEFVRRCLLDSQRFFQVYNAARENFRRERDITNSAQPVPELVRSDEWLELPFWVYNKATHPVNRSKLWCRILGDHQIELSSAPKSTETESVAFSRNNLTTVDENRFGASIRSILRLDKENWHSDWADCLNAGMCVRPRALTNTLFLRYVVADLFVHGIGGGIYDAVTDEIARELWGLKPLAMQVVSASLFLPIDESIRLDSTSADRLLPQISSQTHARERHRMRSAPESFLDIAVPSEALLKHQFDQLLDSMPARGERKAWYVSMKKLRHSIRLAVADREHQLKALSRALTETERESRILRSRETSLVLFPEDDIVRRLGQLLPTESLSSTSLI